MRLRKYFFVLIFIISIIFVSSAISNLRHDSDLVLVFLGGYSMPLQVAVDNGFFLGVSPTQSYEMDSLVYHNSDEIFVSVDGIEETLQEAIDGAGLCGSFFSEYLSSISKGHSGNEISIEIEGDEMTLQEAINEGEFCPLKEVYEGNVLLLHLEDGEGAELFLDSSGEGNDGICISCPTWSPNGKIEGAYYFDGVLDYIEIPRDSSIEPPSAITLSTWFYWNDHTSSVWAKVVGKTTDYEGYPYFSYMIEQSASTQKITAGVSVDGRIIKVPDQDLTEREWHNLVMTWSLEERFIRFYIDGVEAANAKTLSGTITYYDAPLRIGFSGYDQPNTQIDGFVDEVRIWDRALTEEEISALYKLES